jgi:hypothetical protein
MPQLLLQDLALGDVPGVDHHPPDGRVVEEVAARNLHVVPGAVLVPESELYGLVDSAPVHGLDERAFHPLDVFWMHVVEGALTDTLIRSVAQQPLDGGAVIANGAVSFQ